MKSGPAVCGQNEGKEFYSLNQESSIISQVAKPNSFGVNETNKDVKKIQNSTALTKGYLNLTPKQLEEKRQKINAFGMKRSLFWQ